MKTLGYSIFAVLTMFTFACSSNVAEAENTEYYTSYSRFTDPGDFSFMLKTLPDDVMEICEIAKQQTVHQNLMSYFNIPSETRAVMKGVWPPRMTGLLKTLNETGPGNLTGDRQVDQRIIGACVLESHLLAGMLRYKKIPVRIRAGYFKNVRENADFIVDFWEKTLRERGIMADLLQEDPEAWRKLINEHTRRQIAVDHHIEHWICEYWDKERKVWRLLDANNTFLKASSDIDVGFQLPKKHFEYAHEAWKKMRSDANFNPLQYEEEPLDGRSHIKSQMLQDFYSLLNHDVACDDYSSEAYRIVKERRYEELTEEELAELDALADLLSQNPSVDQLVTFYRNSATLKLAAVDSDRYSFVFSE